MPDDSRARTILIREDTPLAANLPIETEPFLPGWRLVKDLDRSTLARNIEGANWNFFYLAGEIRAIALGRKGIGTLRRAVKCVLAKQEGQKFNCVEITKVVSKRFLGLPFVSVTAHFRHIAASRRSGHKAICGSDFNFLGIGRRYENENHALFDSLFCRPAPYGAIASCTGSFQVPRLFAGNEFARTFKPG